MPIFAVGVIPVAGSFVLAAGEGGDPLGTTIFVVDGIVQAAGIAMLVAGIVARTPRLVRDEAAGVHVVPVPLTFGKGSAGFGLGGSF